MLYESVFVWVHRCTWMYSFPCFISRKLVLKILQQTIAASHNFQETWTWNSLPSATSYIFPAWFKAFICQRKKKQHIIPARDFVCIPAPAPLPWPRILAWWTTTSSTMCLPIQIDVTNNGGSAGSVFDLCVLRALWKRKSVWPDGGPVSLKGSFLRVWAKQHSWLDGPEPKSFYMLLISMCICLAFTVVSLTVALSFPMNSLHVRINTHTQV